MLGQPDIHENLKKALGHLEFSLASTSQCIKQQNLKVHSITPSRLHPNLSVA